LVSFGIGCDPSSASCRTPRSIPEAPWKQEGASQRVAWAKTTVVAVLVEVN
jgi:hypothetical protein